MKKLCQSVLAFLMVCVLITSYSFVSNAAGTTTMYLSTNSPKVGDTLKLTVTGSASSTITVKYNATILNFASCDVSGYTQSGNSVTFKGKTGNINFNVAQSGSANIIVSSDSLTGCSTQVQVTGEAVTTTETQTVETTQTAEEIPEETPVEDVTLEGDVERLGNETHFVYVMTPDSLPAASMTEAVYTNSTGSYTLYQFSSVSNEFYYVYGENENGVEGWYVLDSSTGEVFRANTQVLALVDGEAEQVEEEKTGISQYVDKAVDYVKENKRNVLTILILIVAIIIVICINVHVFKRNAEDGDVFDEEDEDDVEEFEDRKAGKKAKKNKSKDEDKKEDDAMVALDLSVVNETLDEEKKVSETKEEAEPVVTVAPVTTAAPILEEEEEDEDDEPRGFFFRKNRNVDVWAEPEEDEEEPEPVKEKPAKETFKKKQSTANREIDLMDLNNL